MSNITCRRPIWGFTALILSSLLIVAGGYSTAAKDGIAQPLARMSPTDIEDALQQCPLVQDLNRHKFATTPQTSSLLTRLFAILFPGNPATNALLATLYISGPPNFLLALCPPDIDPSSLSVMVAFAVGGLLGDTLFHLLPEIFLGEDSPEHVRFVLVQPNRNLLLGVAIMVGILTFVAMDKGLRIATGGSGGHEHGHRSKDKDKVESAPELDTVYANSTGSSIPPKKELKSRKPGAGKSNSASIVATPSSSTEPSPSIRLSAYLNLIADFTHNITDGLALSSSFYASPTLGATTTVAVFFHEIPHEVGDFALLVQSGFSKRRAMVAQFVTAAGAFLGTCLGIAVQEMGKTSKEKNDLGTSCNAGLAGTGLGWGDLLLPFTAGTFLYVGTVAVIPELLETGSHRKEELWKTVKQFVAWIVGAGIMLAISWS